MIPTGSLLGNDLDQETDPILTSNRTYRFDFQSGLIAGKVDGLDAIRQAVFKILQTERFQHLIYSADYGSEVSLLIGKDRRIYQSELKRCIEEALLQDDRISSVEELEISFQEDRVLAQFTVVTLIGSFLASQEVT